MQQTSQTGNATRSVQSKMAILANVIAQLRSKQSPFDVIVDESAAGDEKE